MADTDGKTTADDARRQGQFEGQVLANLADIKKNIENIFSSFAGLEQRTRNLETLVPQLGDQVRSAIATGDEKLRDADKIHTELEAILDTCQKRIRALEDWRLYILGAAGAVAVVVDLILRFWPNK